MNLEIYSLTLTDKKSIPSRLTEHPGYDANPQPLKNKDFFWIQKNENDFKLLKWISKTKKTVEIIKQAQPIWKATWNNSLMTWAWISWGEESPRKTKIYTLNGDLKNTTEKSEKPKVLSLPDGIYHDVSWIPHENRLLLSAQLKGSKDFDIYLFDLKEQCLRPLVLNPGDDIEPSINSRNSFVVYSHKPSEINGNHFQLYKKNLNLNQEPCITASN
jgi:Tol biopolymer transport system component